MATVTIQVRMDADLKQQVEQKLKSMGLNMSTTVNMLAHQIIRQNRLDVMEALGTEVDLISELPKSNLFKDNLKRDEILLYEA